MSSSSSNDDDNDKMPSRFPRSVKGEFTGYPPTVVVSANAAVTASAVMALSVGDTTRVQQIADADRIFLGCTVPELIALSNPPKAADQDLLREKGLDEENPITVAGWAGSEIQRRSDEAKMRQRMIVTVVTGLIALGGWVAAVLVAVLN